MTEHVVSETLRLYPSGWIGSRVATSATEFGGQPIPEGRMVLYSPYLTHRSPDLWADPLAFRPERFSEPVPAWGYIPFSAGERTCLGAALATVDDAGGRRRLRRVHPAPGQPATADRAAR